MRTKLIIVGEAPGADEEAAERETGVRSYFIGKAGRELNAWLSEAGISRSDCYITNVSKVRPPNNRIDLLNPPISSWYDSLDEELSMVEANCILALGETALVALTGKHGISKWRGSILGCSLPRCVDRKVVATFHPAYIIRGMDYHTQDDEAPVMKSDPRPVAIADTTRAAEELEFPELNIPNRQMVIRPSITDIILFLNTMFSDEYASIDIETRGNRIACLGICNNRKESICIPFETITGNHSYWTKDEEIFVLQLLDNKLVNHKHLVSQNGFYDLFFLNWYGLRIPSTEYDTLYMHHLLYPDMPKSLQFMTSLYTRQPYYKDERKNWTKDLDEERLWRYNCLDCICTMEVFDVLLKELTETGQHNMYLKFYQRLMPNVLKMALNGIRIDDELRRRSIKENNSEIEILQASLDAITKSSTNVRSNKVMAKLFYDTLRFKQIKRVGRKGPSTDKKAIAKLSAKTHHPIFDIVIGVRHLQHLRDTYLLAKADVDGRIRTTYNIAGTETGGRLSSSQSPFRTGANLQNIPPGTARKMYIPDPGKIFINADYKQAEARVTAYDAGEASMISAFESGRDVYAEFASIVFGKHQNEITDNLRQIAKKLVLSCNYCIGIDEFATQLKISRVEAREYMRIYFHTFPNILFWQREIEKQLRNNGFITTLFGRKRTYSGFVTNKMIRDAIASRPQGTVGELLNFALCNAMDAGVEVVNQVHDNLLVQCSPEDVRYTCLILKNAMAIPMSTNGMSFTIPVELKCGPNWHDMETISDEEISEWMANGLPRIH